MASSADNQTENDFFCRYNLQIWWLATFSEQERHYIEKRICSPEQDTLAKHHCVVGFLAHVANLFGRPPERSIANRLLDKAESLIDNNTPVLDAHILYDRMIEFAFSYRDRTSNPLSRTIRACEYQILIATEVAAELAEQGPLPGHRGFRQLAMIHEQEENFREAIAICRQAQQQGWSGDWQTKIEHCQNKLAERLLARPWRQG